MAPYLCFCKASSLPSSQLWACRNMAFFVKVHAEAREQSISLRVNQAVKQFGGQCKFFGSERHRASSIGSKDDSAKCDPSKRIHMNQMLYHGSVPSPFTSFLIHSPNGSRVRCTASPRSYQASIDAVTTIGQTSATWATNCFAVQR
jgi:hypothetical protein